MELPEPSTTQSTETSPNPNLPEVPFPNQKKLSFLERIKSLSLVTKLIATLVGFIILIFIAFIILSLGSKSNKIKNNNQVPTSTDSVAAERKRQIAASAAASKQQEPINQLQNAYDAVVGSDSSKRTLTIDSSGTAIIEYEIASTDGQLILKTSFENFADLATRVFNIPTILRLNVTTYANKFTDSYGTPNVYAVKLQITKDTNAKINWSLKKYAYGDYAKLLTLEDINPALSKDYKALTK